MVWTSSNKESVRIRDKSWSPSSTSDQDKTFAQFRVSRFTGDWHWPRSDGGRASTTFGPRGSPRVILSTLPTSRIRATSRIARVLFARATDFVHVVPAKERASGSRAYTAVRISSIHPSFTREPRSSFRFQRPLTIAATIAHYADKQMPHLCSVTRL